MHKMGRHECKFWAHLDNYSVSDSHTSSARTTFFLFSRTLLLVRLELLRLAVGGANRNQSNVTITITGVTINSTHSWAGAVRC